MTKKSILPVACVALQLALLAGLALRYEAVRAHGLKVLLRTAPVDPRSPFRGDYLQLAYDFSSLPRRMVDASVERAGARGGKGIRCYLSFDLDARNVLIPRRLTLDKPAAGTPFLRGWAGLPLGENRVSVLYGLEQYYLQQNTGRGLEQGKRVGGNLSGQAALDSFNGGRLPPPPEPTGVPVPMLMEASVSLRTGLAVLTGWRYEDLGMDVRIEKNSFTALAHVRIANATGQPLAVFDPPQHTAFAVELESPAGAPADFPDVSYVDPADIRVLAPGEVYETTLDLSDPRFQPRRGSAAVDPANLGWNEGLRILYHAPAGRSDLWPGRLISRRIAPYELKPKQP